MNVRIAQRHRRRIRAQFAQILSGSPVTFSKAPTGTPEGREQVIGVLEFPSTRALLTLVSRVMDIQQRLGLSPLSEKEGSLEWLEAKRDIHREQAMLERLADMIYNALWLDIMWQYPQTADPGSEVRIHAGWQVTIKEECLCASCSINRLIDAEGPQGLMRRLLLDELKPEILEALPPEIRSFVDYARTLPLKDRAKVKFHRVSDGSRFGGVSSVGVSVPRRG